MFWHFPELCPIFPVPICWKSHEQLSNSSAQPCRHVAKRLGGEMLLICLCFLVSKNISLVKQFTVSLGAMNPSSSVIVLNWNRFFNLKAQKQHVFVQIISHRSEKFNRLWRFNKQKSDLEPVRLATFTSYHCQKQSFCFCWFSLMCQS